MRLHLDHGKTTTKSQPIIRYMVLRYDSWRPDLPYQLKWDVEPLNGRKSSPGFGCQHLTHDDCLIEKLLCQAPRWENLEMRDGDRYVFTWGEIRVRQIKIAFDKSVWLPYKHIKQLTQNSLETNIKRPIFTIGTVDRKRILNGQNKQRIFTIDLNLGWSILTAETQIFCSIYLVVLIRGSFPETHVHLMYFFSILRNLWRN